MSTLANREGMGPVSTVARGVSRGSETGLDSNELPRATLSWARLPHQGHGASFKTGRLTYNDLKS